ncbi:MAG: ferredoxin [Blastocatellia bacterium]
MADLTERLSENAPGKFYVDRQCIDCDVCRDTAPENFTRNDENGYSFVYKQPETKDEIDLCEEAFTACPVEAIGDNGAEKSAARP